MSSVSSRAQHNARPGRESLSKRLGKVARQIKARDGHRCAYCGATEASSGAPLHLDHLTPRAHGGADVATNLVLACATCNSARQHRPLSAWRVYAAEVYGLAINPRAVRAQARRALPAV